MRGAELSVYEGRGGEKVMVAYSVLLVHQGMWTQSSAVICYPVSILNTPSK